MKAIITSYRRSRKQQTMDECLLMLDSVKTVSAAHAFLGKKVILQVSKNKKMEGKVIAVHGRNGVLRARFTRGLPGQAIGMDCEIRA